MNLDSLYDPFNLPVNLKLHKIKVYNSDQLYFFKKANDKNKNDIQNCKTLGNIFSKKY